MSDSLTPNDLVTLALLIRRGASIPDAAEALGLPRNSRVVKREGKSIRDALGLQPGNTRYQEPSDPTSTEAPLRAHNLKEELKITEQGDTKTYNSYSYGIKTLEDLIKHCEIDTTIWEPEKPIFNTWEMPKPESDTGKISLFQVKCAFRYIAAAADMKRLKEEILEEFRAAAPKPIRRAFKQTYGELGMIHIPDLHLGKKSVPWLEEWGIEGAVRTLSLGLYTMLDRLTKAHELERLVFILGSDFLHADNLMGGTTKGTPVQPSHHLAELQRAGRLAATDAILTCLEIAPTDVITIPGNHDHQSSLALGEMIEARFHNEPHVRVDNSLYARKYYDWGRNLWMFTHGEKVKPRDLPLKMSLEVPKLWAACPNREVEIGHLHTNALINVQPIEEISGVLIRRLSSWSPLDFWHEQEGYIGNVRAAEIFAYDFEDGVTGSARHVVKSHRQ